jgi:hypothetical protein
MKKIYWTLFQYNDVESLNHLKYGTIALTLTDDETGCLNLSETNCFHFFDTEQEAKLFITEVQKPMYFGVCGNYELVFLEPYSDELNALFDKQVAFTDKILNMCSQVEKYHSSSWIVRKLIDIRSLFIKCPNV